MSVSILAASSSNIGGRPAQEDRLVVVEDLNEYIPAERRFEREPPRSLFAVFDGHCGDACSEFLAKTFPVELARNPLLISDPKSALLEVWDALEEKFYGICVQTAIKALKKRTSNHGVTGKGEPTKKRVGFASASFPMDGSTATVLLRVGNKLFVANCGDSAGILIKKTGDVEMITKDHGTLNREESKRVHRSGGYYRQQVLKSSKARPFCCFSTEALVGKPRVYPGGLLVTRSFGDFSAKVAGLGGKPGVILADCEDVMEMTVDEDWAEVIIASDGVWDVLPPHNMPQMLARLGGNGRGRRLKDRLVSSSYSGNRNGKRLGKTWEFPRWGDEDRRLEQAKLNGTCAKLVLACVKDRFWTDNRAVADNASVIILQFFQSASDTSSDSSGAEIL